MMDLLVWIVYRIIFFTSIFDWFIEWQVKNNLFRYSNPLERMFSGSHPRSQETEEGPVGRTDRSVPSANSQKILWDGLTDFERIKRKEIQVPIWLILNSFRIHCWVFYKNLYPSSFGKNSAVHYASEKLNFEVISWGTF